MKSDEPTDPAVDSPTMDESQAMDTPAAPSLYEVSPHHSPFEKTEFVEFAANTKQAVPNVIGNYRILNRVGQGGAGTVYRAESIVDQSIAAVKILRPDIVSNAKAVQRFEKEARLQSEIDSPYVTRLFEFGTHQGLHYLASEFVEGVSLRQLCDRLCRHDKSISLRIIRDVLRALDAMHSRGVIHRDVKPENVLIVFAGQYEEKSVDLETFQCAKLTDFGLARHIEQSESLAMTQQKAILGTPIYLSPEQYAESRQVDARADVYSLGATLYHMLAGVPPFDSDTFMELAEMHRVQRPRLLNSLDPQIGDALSNVVAKSLEKLPDLRYSDAGEMLADIENIIAGRAISIRIYPAIPAVDPQLVRNFSFDWELDATAQDLWPLVSDTDRFNRAMGLPAADFVYENNDANKTGVEETTNLKERKIRASTKFNGMAVSWREHAFQWIEGREMSVLREFEKGPFAWVTSTVELFPLINNRTRLVHRFQVQSRGLIGKLLTPIQFGWLTRKSLNRIYQKIATMARQRSNPLVCDLPFGKSVQLNESQKKKLNEKIAALVRQNSAPQLVEKLSEYLRSAADANVSRIRPKPLAQSFGCAEQEFLTLCLRAAHAGLLSMMWDLICPVCRIASETKDSIKAIANHGHCEACQSDFEIDFRKSVELIFRVHPQIRQTDTKTYCIGGPFNSRHVVAQNRLKPGEQVTIGTQLDEGLYQVRGPQLPDNQEFGVKSGAINTSCHFDLLTVVPRRNLAVGPVSIGLGNPSPLELLTRVERIAERVDATTAAEVNENPQFRELFPQEVLSADQLVNLTHANILLVRIFEFESLTDSMGEVRARMIWQSLVDYLQAELPAATVESSSDGLQIVNEAKPKLLQTIPLFDRWVADQGPAVRMLKFGFAVNGGEVLIGGKRDTEYFGKMVRVCHELLRDSVANQLAATAEYATESEFQEFTAHHLEQIIDDAPRQLKSGITIHRFNLQQQKN